MTTTTDKRVDPETGETVYTNVTLLAPSGFGPHNATFARELRVKVDSYAQHPEAFYVRFKKPKQRKWRGGTYTPGSRVVVVAGNHPELKVDMFHAPEPGSSPGMTVQRGRHSAFAGEWGEEFNEMLASADVEILEDWNKER